MSPGQKFRQALRDEKPLQIPGAINAYHAILAEKSGFPSWVEVDPKNFKGVFKSLPDRAEFANDVNEQLVVELYSK